METPPLPAASRDRRGGGRGVGGGGGGGWTVQVLAAELLPGPAAEQQSGPLWAATRGLGRGLDCFFAAELLLKALAHWRSPRGAPVRDRQPAPPSPVQPPLRRLRLYPPPPSIRPPPLPPPPPPEHLISLSPVSSPLSQGKLRGEGGPAEAAPLPHPPLTHQPARPPAAPSRYGTIPAPRCRSSPASAPLLARPGASGAGSDPHTKHPFRPRGDRGGPVRSLERGAL